MTRRLRNFGTSHDSRERERERDREREGERERNRAGEHWGSSRIRHPSETLNVLPSVLMHSHGNPAKNAKPTNNYSSYTSC